MRASHLPCRPAALLAAACSISGAAAQGPVPATTPVFVLERFFTGRTEGDGRLKVMAAHTRSVQVHGSGHLEADGTIVLNQQVVQAGKAPSRREWRIRRTGPGRYAGTLSDAVGPVTGDVTGNRLRLAFRMKGGLRAEQVLYLQPGGQTALNRMTVRKFGARVAVLNETIRRVE